MSHHIRALCRTALALILLGEVQIARLHAAEGASSVPQLVYVTRKGLDVAHNKIDELISTFGFICLRNPTNPRPCRIENELVSFLKSLPQDRGEIARRLEALGASCQFSNELLTCLYERNVETSAWQATASEPDAVFDEYFRITLNISEHHATPRYEATFDRTETVKRRRENN